MYGLHDLQRDFSRFVFEAEGQIPWGIKGSGLGATQRMAIYRNSCRLGLTEALRELYPVVNRLVGDGFFNRLAAAYVERYPPQMACLLTFGGHFPSLIAGFDAARGLPYLSDVAALEWLWHEVYHEAEANLLSLASLAALAPEQYDRLVFKLHPSARIMTSDYPIHEIWLSNQPEYHGRTDIDLSVGCCRLLLHRPHRQVKIWLLAESEFQLLALLAAGKTLTQSVEAVITRHPDLNLQSLLQRWLFNGFFIDLSIV